MLLIFLPVINFISLQKNFKKQDHSFVSHDLNEVSALANYVVILKGRPAQCQFIDHFNNTSDYSLSSKHNISWQHIAPLWHALYEQN